MEIENKCIDEIKAECCNEHRCDFYRLKEWSKDIWFCSSCFSEQLFYLQEMKKGDKK